MIRLALFSFLMTFFVSSANAQGSAPIIVLAEPFSCLRGEAYLPIEVTAGGEVFQFQAECRETLEQDFTTQSGDYCQIYSTMCSLERESVRVWVHCDRLGHGIERIACPIF